METQRTTLSFLTKSMSSAVGFSSMRRVVMTLLVMLLTTVSAIAQDNYWLTLDANYDSGTSRMIPVSSFNPTRTLTQDDVPIRAGHEFYGWSETPTGDIKYVTGDVVTLYANLTLYAVWGKTINSLTYTITNEDLRQAKLSGYEGEQPTGALNIPADITINGISYSVTSIGNRAFDGCPNLESVTLPNSVTSIGYNAFYGCSSLQSVTIPNSVTSIGDGAFRGCDNLKSITIPKSVTSIGDHAFDGCSSLESIILNSMPEIGTKAFNNTPATVMINLTASYVNGDKWTTFYNNDYNFQADENTTVYKATVDGSSLVLTEVADRIVNSHTAVILKSTGNPVMTLTTSNSSDTNGNDLRGYSDRTLRTNAMTWNGANAIYTMGNTSAGFGFHKYTGKYVPAGKAFLPLNTSNGAKAILTMVFADMTTGVSELQVSNDQLPVYDLNGRKVSENNLKPGVYVKNGKKFVVK